MSEQAITSGFTKYFYLVRADTPQLREKVFHIRYQVYCKEFNYEDEADCPGQMEKDDYDDHSEHSLLIHRPSGTPVGCVRLVHALRDDPYYPLPFEKYCDHALNRDLFDPLAVPRDKFGEFSRLAVLSSFRRRKDDEHKPISINENFSLAASGRDNFPFIPVGLFLAALSMSLNAGFLYTFAMMEPRLSRLLKRFGILFEQVGEVVDYHGPRGPFIIRREAVMAHLKPEVQDLMLLIDKQLSKTAYDT
ncbi:MAG: PEP-CTERM/exosortase system-associated acyltransferase [Pseudomonadota bacterium]|nr:PEP-CTERM/exosortase system-associated acyltransferase [Pseudomonadota bacterium]